MTLALLVPPKNTSRDATRVAARVDNPVAFKTTRFDVPVELKFKHWMVS